MKYVLLVILALAAGIFGGVVSDRVISAVMPGDQETLEQVDAGTLRRLETLRSRSGIQITVDDTDDQESLTLETPGGQTIILKDSAASIELHDSDGNSVKMEAGNITMKVSGKVIINASAVEVTTGLLTANAGMSRFLGAVQVDTLIANSVVSSTYTTSTGK